jgi:hypothetical protein
MVTLPTSVKSGLLAVFCLASSFAPISAHNTRAVAEENPTITTVVAQHLLKEGLFSAFILAALYGEQCTRPTLENSNLNTLIQRMLIFQTGFVVWKCLGEEWFGNEVKNDFKALKKAVLKALGKGTAQSSVGSEE